MPVRVHGETEAADTVESSADAVMARRRLHTEIPPAPPDINRWNASRSPSSHTRVFIGSIQTTASPCCNPSSALRDILCRSAPIVSATGANWIDRHCEVRIWVLPSSSATARRLRMKRDTGMQIDVILSNVSNERAKPCGRED